MDLRFDFNISFSKKISSFCLKTLLNRTFLFIPESQGHLGENRQFDSCDIQV